MNNEISIAMTFKNRAKFLVMKLENILYQNYDHKQIEISLSDGYSSDNIDSVIKKYYRYFQQIIYAKSSRSVLPFKVRSNNPTADVNAQICNLVTKEKVVKTDPEVMFTDRHSLQYVSEVLNEPETLIYHDCITQTEKDQQKYTLHGEANFCVCFNKSTYIRDGGIEELFARGFACEDTTFIRKWGQTKKVILSEHKVLHIWHENPAYQDGNLELLDRYSLPLQRIILNSGMNMNKYNPRWKRKEMIKGIKVYRG